MTSGARALPLLRAAFAAEAIELGAHPWTARDVALCLLPGVDRTLARLVADADDRVGSLAHARAQASADAGVLRRVQVTVADVEVRIDDVVVPALEEGRDMLLHHRVGRADAD